MSNTESKAKPSRDVIKLSRLVRAEGSNASDDTRAELEKSFLDRLRQKTPAGITVGK